MAITCKSSQSLYSSHTIPLFIQTKVHIPFSPHSRVQDSSTVFLHFMIHQFIISSSSSRTSKQKLSSVYQHLAIIKVRLHSYSLQDQGLQTFRLSPRDAAWTWGRRAKEGREERGWEDRGRDEKEWVFSANRWVLSASLGGELGAERCCLSARCCCRSIGELGGEG